LQKGDIVPMQGLKPRLVHLVATPAARRDAYSHVNRCLG